LIFTDLQFPIYELKVFLMRSLKNGLSQALKSELRRIEVYYFQVRAGWILDKKPPKPGGFFKFISTCLLVGIIKPINKFYLFSSHHLVLG